MIETVDSFQGKQLDVIILSCVRASDRKCAISDTAHQLNFHHTQTGEGGFVILTCSCKQCHI